MKANNQTVQLLFIVDLIIFNLGLFLAFFILYGEVSYIYNLYNFNLLMFFNLNWIFISYFSKTYRPFQLRKIDKSIKRLARGFLLHILFTISYLLIFEHIKNPLKHLVLTYTIILILLSIWRVSHFFYYLNRIKNGFNQRKVIVIGNGSTALELKEYLLKNEKSIGLELVNHFYKKDISSISVLNQYLLDQNITEIFCSIPDVDEDSVRELNELSANNGIKLNLIPEIRSYYYSKSRVDFIGAIPILFLKEFPLDDDFNIALKRLFDIIFSLIVIIGVFSWLFPIIAFCIKLESKGPIFFTQKRSGKGYKSFNCYKFRSMKVPKSESEMKFKQATKNDARITKVGALLRKTSIDEFPQFFNVLIGNMSVVGPRPHPLDLDKKYKEIINKYMSRHLTKPGITGLSQIMGYRGETKDVHDMKARVILDNFYIENWTFFFDIKIILLTAYNMLFKKEENAY